MSELELYKELASWEDFQAAPVSTFSHSPLSWEFDRHIVRGLIVEVPHFTKESTGTTSHWLAVIVRKAGYLVQLRWLGDDGSNSEKYFWRHVAAFREPLTNQSDTRVFPAGWAKANNVRLEPPIDIRDSRLSWADFVESELRGRETLPEDFHRRVKVENESCFERGMKVEATALEKMSAVKPALVEGDVGRRLMLRYLDTRGIPQFCWFHEFSEMIMPCGWSRLHGRQLISMRGYPDPPEIKKMLEEPTDGNASIFHFKPLLIPESRMKILNNYRFELGSKLEVIDPSEAQCINVGTIVRVLENQYLVIRIDGVYAPDGSEHQVCLHASSPYLLPAGFAAEYNLMAYFQPPNQNFSYEGTTIVPPEILKKAIPHHHLRANQFLEAVGVWATDRICVARTRRVVAHLVLIHFEGFGSSDDQFFPISSPDLYPIGWCHLVGHRLRTPRSKPLTLRDDDGYGRDDGRRRIKNRRETVAVRLC